MTQEQQVEKSHDSRNDPSWQERDTIFDAEVERDVELLLVDGSTVKGSLHSKLWKKDLLLEDYQDLKVTFWSIGIKDGENIDNIKRQLFEEEAAIAHTDFPIYAVKKWRPAE